MTAVAALALSGLGYVVLSPLYESGTSKFIAPVLGAIDLWIAVAVLKRSAWLKRWLRPIAIGTLIVALPFWGQSEDFYGSLAVPMLVVESSAILAALCLFLLSFMPSFRTHAQDG